MGFSHPYRYNKGNSWLYKENHDSKKIAPVAEYYKINMIFQN